MRRFTWTPDNWGKWVDKPDPSRQYAVRLVTTRALDLLSADAGECILNAGCGFGREASILLSSVPDLRLVGVDSSSHMLERATDNLSEWDTFTALQTQLEYLPFQDSSFDKIVCMGVIMHVADERVTCRELLRVLKPGGRLVLTFNSLAHPLSPLAIALIWWSKRGQPGFKLSFRFATYYSHVFQRAGARTKLFPGSFSVGFGPSLLLPVQRWLDDHLAPHIPWATYEPILVVQK